MPEHPSNISNHNAAFSLFEDQRRDSAERMTILPFISVASIQQKPAPSKSNPRWIAPKRRWDQPLDSKKRWWKDGKIFATTSAKNIVVTPSTAMLPDVLKQVSLVRGVKNSSENDTPNSAEDSFIVINCVQRKLGIWTLDLCWRRRENDSGVLTKKIVFGFFSNDHFGLPISVRGDSTRDSFVHEHCFSSFSIVQANRPKSGTFPTKKGRSQRTVKAYQ